MDKISYLVLLAVMVFSFNMYAMEKSHGPYRGCYMIMAGKDATVDGSVLVAHNNDLTGGEAVQLQIIPENKRSEKSWIPFSTGLRIPSVHHNFRWIVMNIHRGFAEGDAIAINQFQVAIGGGVALGKDRNPFARKEDPLNRKGLTGGIRFIALSRSKSARDCVRRLGRFYSDYGVTYPSGVAVSDPKEVWYIESGGGYCWAAVRIPDNSYMIAANGYRIGKIDIRDRKNIMVSANLKSLARRKWGKRRIRTIHFSRLVGGGRTNSAYNSRRIWSGIRHLNPSFQFQPDRSDFPMFIVPERKIDLRQMAAILRDRYEGSRFESAACERRICTPFTVHSSIVQLRAWLPPKLGGVLWAGIGAPDSTPYIPIYLGILEIHPAFRLAPERYDRKSAFWRFKEISNLMIPFRAFLKGPVSTCINSFEQSLFSGQKPFEQHAMSLFRTDRSTLGKHLTEHTLKRCSDAIMLATRMQSEIHTIIAHKSRELDFPSR